MNAAEELRRVRVVAVSDAAVDVRAYELAPADGRALPEYTAGSHIDVYVPSGLVRQYSLCGDMCTPPLAAVAATLPPEGALSAPWGGPAARVRSPHRYRIAVKKEPGGRGGSLSMHEDVEVGSVLAIGLPRNYFALSPEAGASLLIAGGIGITPIYAMVQSLAAGKRPWTLHYCARSAAHAAFYREIEALRPDGVVAHFSEVPVLDVAALLDAQSPDTQLYCCGPVGLMSAVKAAAASWDPHRVHFEWFAAPAVDHTQDAAFEIELKRSGTVLTVPADRTILEVVRECGIDAPSACEQGVCGTCETRLLAGEGDHRDLLLTADERAENRSIMICVSRARSKRLVLDL